MVKQIQGKYKVNSPDLKPLWQKATDCIAQLDAFEITHALRHKNKAADALANQAMDRGTRRNVMTTVEEPPPPVPKSPPIQTPAIQSRPTRNSGPRSKTIEPVDPIPNPTRPTMLRGFTKNGSIQLLGGATLPDGVFVKIIRE